MVRSLLCGLMATLLAGAALADLSGWRIGIDPGHGGSDPGAIGPTGLQEKEVNLDASLGARYFLVRQGAEVYMTRTSDAYLSLSSRANFMNSNDVDRCICVHHNSSSNPDPNWHLSYVAEGTGWGTSGNMAYDISHRVTDFNGLPFGWSNCGREGVYEENFYMLVYTTMPAVLPEISFISNPQEEQRLYSNRYCYGNGRGIYLGLMDHLGGWEAGIAGKIDYKSRNITDQTGGLTLLENHPNPFNLTTVIRFDLPQAAKVRLDVFDIGNRLVRTVIDGWIEAGHHEVGFDGSGLSSGVYVYRIQAGDLNANGKMILIK